MKVNIQILIKACQELNYNYQILHENGNLVRVNHGGKSEVFLNTITPINTEAASHLMKDKEYFYNYFKDCINMPKTKGYLNPECQEEYQHYVKFTDLESISKDLELNFTYPVIIKRNRGTWGINVFKCNNSQEAIEALGKVFYRDNNYDYVAIVQQYIEICQEYRALFMAGNLHCVYEKDISQANFSGNLSRLHWEGSQAKIITDTSILAELNKFCQPLVSKDLLRYVGLDVAVDVNNNFWIIEANSSPGLDYLVRDNGEAIAIAWYKKALLLLFAN